VPASGSKAAAIAARLSALGLSVRVEEQTDCTLVEAELPDSLSDESWREALEAVAEADRFGLFVTSVNGRTLWAAVVKKEVPTTGDVGGPGRQR
jgi:hypothetical protein